MKDDIINQDEIDQLFADLGADEENTDQEEGDGFLSQDEIDKMMGGSSFKDNSMSQNDIDSLFMDESPTPEIQQNQSLINQDEIDALLNGGDSTLPTPTPSQPAPPPSTSGMDLINQDEIDALLNGGDSPPVSPKPAFSPTPAKSQSAPPPVTISNGSDIISQDELDMLLGSLSGEEEKAPPTRKESPQPVVQAKPVPTPPQQKPQPKPQPAPAAKPASASESLMDQSEIDALLNFMETEPPVEETGPPADNSRAGSSSPQIPLRYIQEMQMSAPSPQKNFKLYDFRRPEKLSRDQIRRIRSYFDPMYRHLTNYFSVLLRTSVDVALIEVDQITYGEIFKNIGAPVINGIFSTSPSYPNGIIQFNTKLFYSILERMMGGKGDSATDIRDITDFERYLLTDILNKILEFYKEAIVKLTRVDPVVEAVESDLNLLPKTLSEDEVLVRLVFQININGLTGYVNLSMLHKFIAPYFSQYRVNRMENEESKEEIFEKVQKRRYGKLAVPISVEFTTQSILTSQLAQLKKGDIIPLEHKFDQPLNVRVNRCIKYRGTPGKKGQKIAIRIKSAVINDD